MKPNSSIVHPISDSAPESVPESFSRRRLLRNTAVMGAAAALLPPLAGCAALSTSGQKPGSVSAGDLPQSIADAGQALRSGKYSSEELTRAYLQAIAQFQPKLNAFITITGEQALADARRLDQELKAGKDRGPLHGVPIVHKDLYDTKGVRTTVGSGFFRNRIPTDDAAVVTRLAAAGAITLGKTNMNEFAAGITGTNEFFGDIHNPWDLTRSPGGSSSGTGAAIAAGLCLAGTGSDTGGSIRVPSAWDNLTGIRPSFGRVSLTGVFPRSYSLDCAGPLARSAQDAAVMLSAMAGYDASYKYSVNAPAEDFSKNLHQGVKGLKVGIINQYTFRDVDADVAHAVEQAARTLEAQGAQIVPVDIPLLAKPLDLSALFTILLYEFNQILGDQFRAAPDKNQFGKIVQSDIAKGEKISRDSYEHALTARKQLLAQFNHAFTQVDVLITPTMPTTAPILAPSGPAYDRGRQFMLPISWTGLPAMSAPCGFDSQGLPIGMQLIGPALRESLLLQVANAHQKVTDFYLKHPPIYA
ncbi:amidase [Paraburkholderia sp. ZP32-5]|uniref:amidase n=1 Tax=Paraburkholderia sp. ZP32-5 TaxID=2883245 RepID=UPI001F25811D|nr:amidase [Paraburkholderia sp. ZP32-5]